MRSLHKATAVLVLLGVAVPLPARADNFWETVGKVTAVVVGAKVISDVLDDDQPHPRHYYSRDHYRRGGPPPTRYYDAPQYGRYPGRFQDYRSYNQYPYDTQARYGSQYGSGYRSGYGATTNEIISRAQSWEGPYGSGSESVRESYRFDGRSGDTLVQRNITTNERIPRVIDVHRPSGGSQSSAYSYSENSSDYSRSYATSQSERWREPRQVRGYGGYNYGYSPSRQYERVPNRYVAPPPVVRNSRFAERRPLPPPRRPLDSGRRAANLLGAPRGYTVLDY